MYDENETTGFAFLSPTFFLLLLHAISCATCAVTAMTSLWKMQYDKDSMVRRCGLHIPYRPVVVNAILYDYDYALLLIIPATSITGAVYWHTLHLSSLCLSWQRRSNTSPWRKAALCPLVHHRT
jgi:hypothetical protein